MTIERRIGVCFVLAAACAFEGCARRSPAPATEAEKIEGLIAHVAAMQDARFIRNGQEYTGANAADFMRGKWQANTGKVATAEDFIREVATVSTTPGDAYTIRFDDGMTIASGDYLKMVLRQITVGSR